MHHQTGHLKTDSPHVDRFDTRLSKDFLYYGLMMTSHSENTVGAKGHMIAGCPYVSSIVACHDTT